MIKLFRKISFFLLILTVFSTFSVSRAEAFSFTINPITILEGVANVIIVKISDTINYLIIQKKYLFDNFTDPNTYSSLKIPASIDKFLASTTPSVPVKKEAINISKPVVIVTPTIPDVKKISSFGSDSKILSFTNKERTAVSLAPLSANSVLDTVAGQRADDLFANQYFAHESPDNKSAVDLAEKIGYKYLLIGENLALGDYGDDQGIVTAWMNSPGHKANILNKKYTELGVSVKKGVYKGEETIIAVQIFGLPLANCPQPDPGVKFLIESSSVSIKQMQADALSIYNNINAIKNNAGLDRSYYNQKIQEYNYSAKKVNEAVAALKSLIDSYNLQVSKYNTCTGS
jgi:uncharacterized protein YkwD